MLHTTVVPLGSSSPSTSTSQGLRLLAQQREGIVTGLSTVVAEWPPERLDRSIADLQQFNTDIERVTGRPWPRSAGG
ncbi:hypothetical protein ACFZAV_09830 [Streptomyces sp. NPDC008343]|uniref:hypothetical protein n=1 Tax=Streptomyces sp. NPDC008343 TaxID=3364828 RepID=UPI0036E19E4E